MPERVLLSWSGGKDSSLALSALRTDPETEVVGLLTSITSEYERVSIHGVRRSLLRAQARALGLQLYEFTIEPACSNQEYEAAFLDALDLVLAEHPGLRRVAFGDLFLTEVREYRERLLAARGLTALFPLWNADTRALAQQFVTLGYQATLVCVDTTQLSSQFAGRRFDHSLLADLPESVDPCGERGEFHTFVSAGPIFPQPVPYRVGAIVQRDDRFTYCDLIDLPDAPATSG